MTVRNRGRGSAGSKPLATVYTQVVRHCLDMADADYEIADAFLDGIIGGLYGADDWLK